MRALDCDVCEGYQVIRWAIRPPFLLDNSANKNSSKMQYKEFPCPQCSKKVPESHVSILRVTTIVHDRPDKYSPDFIEHTHHDAARQLVEHLFKSGCIDIVQGPKDISNMSYPIHATLGVVSAGAVASIDERIKEHQSHIADNMAADIIKSINKYGSFYGQESVLKAVAVSLVSDALKRAQS